MSVGIARTKLLAKHAGAIGRPRALSVVPDGAAGARLFSGSPSGARRRRTPRGQIDSEGGIRNLSARRVSSPSAVAIGALRGITKKSRTRSADRVLAAIDTATVASLQVYF